MSITCRFRISHRQIFPRFGDCFALSFFASFLQAFAHIVCLFVATISLLAFQSITVAWKGADHLD
jgi:hypothetical protein